MTPWIELHQMFDETPEVRANLRYYKTSPQLSSPLSPSGLAQAKENYGENTKCPVLKPQLWRAQQTVFRWGREKSNRKFGPKCPSVTNGVHAEKLWKTKKTNIAGKDEKYSS